MDTTTTIIKTRSTAAFALIAWNRQTGEPRIAGYAHSKAAADKRARKEGWQAIPIEAGEVLVLTVVR